MSELKRRRLALLCRLREMHVERARTEHLEAQSAYQEKRELAEETQRRIESLDDWAGERLAGTAPVPPEVLRQVHLLRGAECLSLERQRADQAQSLEGVELARGELAQKFEELSVAERLAQRHQKLVTTEQLRHGYVELDDAGVQSKLDAKEKSWP
jgi:hypothetical protein